LDEETAALEIILAQFSRSFRTKFGCAYPTTGEEDLHTLYRLSEQCLRGGKVHVAKLLRLWLLYLATAGKDATIAGFESWFARYTGTAHIIRFPDRA